MNAGIRIGIDLDGVLIDHREHKCRLAKEFGHPLEPWQANSNVMRRFVPGDVYESIQAPLYGHLTPSAPPVAGALEALPMLPGEIYIVSARRSESVRFAQEWLLAHRVYDAVPAERIFFCGTDEEKRGYCERLGIAVFLDDKVKVLDLLPRMTKRVLFDEDEVAKHLDVGDRFHVAKNWDEFRSVLESK